MPIAQDDKIKITNALRSLGHTPDEIASNLQKLGIKGVPVHPCRCPIAKYITMIAGCKVSVAVHEWRYVKDSGDCESNWSKIPAPIMEFIKNFDHSQYKDLIQS